MKKLRSILFALLIPAGFAANAQTETVAISPKKLQQFYLSVGTGPAITTSKTSRALGGTYLFNITGAFGPSSVFRFNVQKDVFTNYRAATPGLFSYLPTGGFNNNNYFPFPNRNTSISLSYGKRKKLNNLIQVQTLAGLGFNVIDTFEYPSMEAYLETGEVYRCATPFVRTYYQPGLLIQTEAMFLPSKFAGLTVGAFANLTPKLPSAGINLSLNLGLLK